MKADALSCDVARMVSRYLEDLGTQMSLNLKRKLEAGDFEAILSVDLDPRDYSNSADYAADAAAVGILRKYEKLPSKVDKRAAAVEKWWQGERDCYLANERLTRYLPEHAACVDRDPLVERIVLSARKVIRSWIGAKPDDLAIGRFGKGSTFSDKAGKSTVPHKMSSVPAMTRGAIYFLPQWLGTQWGAYQAQHHGKVNYVLGNRYSTAPKNARTHRSIACEPSINMFFQLALGRQLRHRLKSGGHWDLDRVQELHRQVAESSSVTREFATLDLSNASDTVCKTLVKVLMPPDWYDQLDGLRSPKTLIDGKWVVLEKFSSMGNGFTFELETLIFAALSVVVTRECGGGGWLGRDVFVFGDDIIVKNDYARPLKSVLEFFGFTLNEEKSFYGEESFRESCGGDYFAGKPVRPYFLKEEPNGPEDYIAIANGLTAARERLALSGIDLSRRSWFTVLDCIPTRVRNCRGPQGLGDIVIHDEPERWTTRWRSSIRYVQVFRPWKYRKVLYQCFEPEIILACATYGCGGSDIGGVIPRDAVLSYKVGWMAYS